MTQPTYNLFMLGTREVDGRGVGGGVEKERGRVERRGG